MLELKLNHVSKKATEWNGMMFLDFLFFSLFFSFVIAGEFQKLPKCRFVMMPSVNLYPMDWDVGYHEFKVLTVFYFHGQNDGLCFDIEAIFPDVGFPIIQIRQSHNHLMSVSAVTWSSLSWLLLWYVLILAFC